MFYFPAATTGQLHYSGEAAKLVSMAHGEAAARGVDADQFGGQGRREK